MNIFKINLLILYLFIVKSKCGLIDSVFGTVKNTTNALRTDVHNIVSYGNDLLFGDPVKTTEVDNNSTQVSKEPKTEGLLTNLYHGSINAFNNFRQGVRNIFVKDDNGHPHKGIITRVFDRINKRLKSIEDHFKPATNPKKILEEPLIINEDFLHKDSKVVRDKVINILYRNNTNMFNKLNISESDVYDLFKDTKVTEKEQLVLPTDAEIKGDVDINIDVRSLADTVKNKL